MPWRCSLGLSGLLRTRHLTSLRLRPHRRQLIPGTDNHPPGLSTSQRSCPQRPKGPPVSCRVPGLEVAFHPPTLAPNLGSWSMGSTSREADSLRGRAFSYSVRTGPRGARNGRGTATRSVRLPPSPLSLAVSQHRPHVDGYQRVPPCAVATPPPFSLRAMTIHPNPRDRIRSMRRRTSGPMVTGRPSLPPWAFFTAKAAFVRSARSFLAREWILGCA